MQRKPTWFCVIERLSMKSRAPYWGLLVFQNNETAAMLVLQAIPFEFGLFCGQQEDPAILISRLLLRMRPWSHVCSQHSMDFP